MKLLYTMFTILVLLLTRNARAETELVRARFTSQVELEVLRETACGLQPTLTLDGRAHPVDLRVGLQRCASTPLTEGSIPLVVRIEPGEPRYVVLEIDVPDDISADALRGAIADMAGTLRTRIMRATAPPPITVAEAHVTPVPVVPSLAAHTVYARSFTGKGKNDWAHARHGIDGHKLAGVIIGGVIGVAFIVGVGFLAASAFQSFHGLNFY